MSPVKDLLEEEKREKREYNKSLLFYVMIMLVICLAVYMIYFTRSESFKCMSSPLVYGVNNIQSSNGNPVYCTCTFDGAEQNLIITRNNMTLISIKKFDYTGQESYKLLNLTFVKR